MEFIQIKKSLCELFFQPFTKELCHQIKVTLLRMRLFSDFDFKYFTNTGTGIKLTKTKLQ